MSFLVYVIKVLSVKYSKSVIKVLSKYVIKVLSVRRHLVGNLKAPGVLHYLFETVVAGSSE